MSGDIAEAKRRLPVPALLHRLGLGEHAKKSARCPFHEDKHNSFSIYKDRNGRWRFKCFTGCGEGDEITFLELYEGISDREAIKHYLELAGVNGSTPPTQKSKSAGATSRSNDTERSKAFDWQTCVDVFTQQDLERFADERAYSIEFCSWLKQSGLIGLHEGCVAFPIRDESGKVVAAHYNSNGGESHWLRYPKGFNTRAIVVGEMVDGDPVHVFESQYDAFAFMDVSGERSGIIITLGAENGKLVDGLIPASATVYAWKQNDRLKKGKRAGDEWLTGIAGHAGARVLWVKTPEQFKDLNDWTRAGARSEDLLQAMLQAETVFEPEKSWSDALNESVVTSNELHGLKLVPRRKLLGDWFCESDCGFIFAFRGVGKTWFALAIAQALSSGGNLGDWQAHEKVKVLYADGEMPADLMRARCAGLEGNNDNLQFLNHEILFDRTGKVLNITNPEVQQAITQRCIRSGAKVLILDNLSTLASGMKENEADSWERLNNWLLDLRRRKIAVVIVHHAGRSGEMRGTSRREDNVFWIIALDDAKKHADDTRGARFISYFTKPSRNTQEEIPAYQWWFVTEKATGIVTIGHKQAQTLDVFRSIIDAGVTERDQIAAEMKLPKYTVSRLAKKAMDAGWLRKRGRNYELIKPGDEGEKNGKKKAKK
jgi:hypothetical protein